MSSSAVKRKLSGTAAGGLGVKVVATASAGTTIHTAVAGTTPGTYEEIYLWAYNHHTASVTLTIEFGETELPITLTVPAKVGLIPVIPGLILQNGVVVAAFASVANVVKIHGFVNSMED